MKTPLTIIALLAGALALSAKPYTPEPGSPERKAICDAMRKHVQKENRRLRTQTFLFKVEFLRVDNGYAGFEGFPVKPDGSFFPNELTGDIVYTTFLRKQDGVWRVVRDLSRSDVPSDEEAAEIRRNFPADFPSSAMPGFWRKLLRP